MSPALDLNAYVVGEMVGTGRWDGEREMGIGLHAHREDRHVWSRGGLVGVLYHFQDFRLAIAMDVLGPEVREWPLPNCSAPKSSVQLIYGPTSSRLGLTQSPVLSS
jgi:hypothetical protein